MLDFNWNPTTRQLRQFAAAALVLLPLAAWIFCGMPRGESWHGHHAQILGGLAALGGVLVVVSWVAPRVVRPVFVGLSLAAFPIGMVVSEAMLMVIYFAVFTPVALVFRLVGRDALERKIDRNRASYWTPKKQPPDVTSYFRQS